jgi:hypothetical protein
MLAGNGNITRINAKCNGHHPLQYQVFEEIVQKIPQIKIMQSP